MYHRYRFVAFTLLFVLIFLLLPGCIFGTGSNGSSKYANEDYSLPEGYVFNEKSPDLSYGKTEEISYYSTISGIEKHAIVILPASYDSGRSYPVLYLLHGIRGNETSWPKASAAAYIVQNLHFYENTAEMIVVCSNDLVGKSEDDADYKNNTDLINAHDAFRNVLIQELMPYINANYNTLSGRDNTAIAGYSIGGREALYIGFTCQDIFGYVGAFAPSSLDSHPEKNANVRTLLEKFEIDKSSPGFHLVMINVGKDDTDTGEFAEKYDKMLSDANIDHIFYKTEGKHEKSVWENGLYNFARRIFSEQYQ